jgi:arylsulfatase A-like enzyme
VDDGYKDDAVEKLGSHTPAGPLRGGKYSNFEAGTRVPFVVSVFRAREARRVERARFANGLAWRPSRLLVGARLRSPATAKT